MSNCAYFASRTPSATFSKSQNTARLRASGLAGTLWNLGLSSLVDPGLKPLEVEVDHDDGVFLDDADQHDHADEGVHVELDAEGRQREQRAQACGGQPRQDGER